MLPALACQPRKLMLPYACASLILTACLCCAQVRPGLPGWGQCPRVLGGLFVKIIIIIKRNVHSCHQPGNAFSWAGSEVGRNSGLGQGCPPLLRLRTATTTAIHKAGARVSRSAGALLLCPLLGHTSSKIFSSPSKPLGEQLNDHNQGLYHGTQQPQTQRPRSSEPSVKVPGVHPHPLHPGVQLLARVLVPPGLCRWNNFLRAA